MKVVFVQPALPAYRLPFFKALSLSTDLEIVVWYSEEGLGVLTQNISSTEWGTQIGSIHPLFAGLEWQGGATFVPISRGDVVVISGNPRCLSNLALLLRARLRGAKTVWWGHYWSSTSRMWRHAIRLLLMRASDAVLFYTDKEVTEYRNRTAGRDSRIIRALNNGIDAGPIELLRQPYDGGRRDRALLFIGRLTAKAQLELVLEALTHPETAGMTLHVIGWGDEGPSLQDTARVLGLEQRVHWHGATTDEMRIAAVANRCALFVYPGSVGLSLIHGMAYGLPSVVHANRWHHMPEIAAFAPRETGFTFEEGSAASLANTLVDALSDRVRLERMSCQSIETVHKSFNTAEMVRRFVAAVQDLARGIA